MRSDVRVDHGQTASILGVSVGELVLVAYLPDELGSVEVRRGLLEGAERISDAALSDHSLNAADDLRPETFRAYGEPEVVTDGGLSYTGYVECNGAAAPDADDDEDPEVLTDGGRPIYNTETATGSVTYVRASSQSRAISYVEEELDDADVVLVAYEVADPTSIDAEILDAREERELATDGGTSSSGSEQCGNCGDPADLQVAKGEYLCADCYENADYAGGHSGSRAETAEKARSLHTDNDREDDPEIVTDGGQQLGDDEVPCPECAAPKPTHEPCPRCGHDPYATDGGVVQPGELERPVGREWPRLTRTLTFAFALAVAVHGPIDVLLTSAAFQLEANSLVEHLGLELWIAVKIAVLSLATFAWYDAPKFTPEPYVVEGILLLGVLAGFGLALVFQNVVTLAGVLA